MGWSGLGRQDCRDDSGRGTAERVGDLSIGTALSCAKGRPTARRSSDGN